MLEKYSTKPPDTINKKIQESATCNLWIFLVKVSGLFIVLRCVGVFMKNLYLAFP